VSLLEVVCRLRYASGFRLDAAFTTQATVTALLGPSASGKTSILSAIAGLRRPDAGRICLRGRVLFDSAAGINQPPEARHVGYVFQGQLLFPHLSVRRNLLYGRQRRAHDAGPITLERIVQVLELADVLDRLPHTLSGGQGQRVALGRALLSGPGLLLLDEPLASLDGALKERVLGYVEQVLHEWHIPTLYVSHDADEVKRLAERVIRLEAGRVLPDGAAAAVRGGEAAAKRSEQR
jgi:molybdate transport system ATP-binding protein